MNVRQIPSRHSTWDDLDALVVEEMEALAGPPPIPALPVPFLDDEKFLAAALSYLDGHADRDRLLAVLAGEPLPPPSVAPSDGPMSGEPASQMPDPPPDKESGQ
jgi:hypothetical protein